MTPITLPVGSLIKFNSVPLSEHNRLPMSIGYNRIERVQRMSNGTLRKFFIANKKTLNVSWDQLPSYSNYTVDGGYGALDLKTFYESASGKATFPVTISYSTSSGSTTETFNASFTAFSCEVTKRNVYSEISYKKADITAVTHNGSTITYTAPNSFAVGQAVSVSGLETEIYNVSQAIITAANSTSFTVAKAGSRAVVTEASSDGTKFTYYATNTFSAGDVITISGFESSSFYNKTNVDILSAEDYFFTVADTRTPAAVTLTTSGLAEVFAESTRFAITKLEPTLNTSVKYTSAGHDLEVGDVVSISGIRSTATITGAVVHTTPGQIKYTAVNTFQAGDLISISGITPSPFNLSKVEVISATSSEFIVANPTTEKYRKGGSSSSIFNLSNVTVSAVTTDTFTVPFSNASGSEVATLSNVFASKRVNYIAYANTVSTPQEFWSISLSLEEV
jgi:hypothetical protein